MKKKKILSNILFYYSAIASFFIAISAAINSEHSTGINSVVFVMLFLPVTSYFIVEFFRHLKSIISKNKRDNITPEARPRKNELIIIISIFLILTLLGLGNTYKNSKAIKESPSQEEETTKDENKNTPQPLVFKTKEKEEKKTLIVKITDGSSSVNIREKPSVYSEKIGEAKDKDIFKFTKKTSGFYEIELKDGETGYLYSKYAEEVK